ncbi:MAG: hemolysin family protein [Candidatus Peribacteraceae bacterium]|nr:hemolysin family protein [Candidatus Peribacteraceae bacterium]
MIIIIEILIIAGLIVLNGYFALSEIALLSVKKSRLKYLAKQGNTKAQKALLLVRQSPEMLSTIQIAITTIGIFAGAFGGATVAEHFANWLSTYQSIAAYSEAISVTIVVIVITYFSLIIGELVPKQMALSNSEKLSLQVAGTITTLMKICTPMVHVLSASTTGLLKLLRIQPAPEHTITEEEIKLLIAGGVESGAFEKAEQKMVENIFHLGNRPITDFMTPNKEVVWLDVSDPILVIKDKISTSESSVFPVCQGNIHHPIGAIESNDILTHLFTNGLEKTNLKSLIQPVMRIDANLPSMVAIDRLKKSSISIAFVTDKTTDKIVGIMSFHDILEAVVGEFQMKQ